MSDKPTDINVIFIGSKPITAYVMAAVTQFNRGVQEVTLKARGRAISRCVDVAEVLRRRFMIDQVAIKSVKTDTEQITTREGGTSNVSSIEIVIEKIE